MSRNIEEAVVSHENCITKEIDFWGVPAFTPQIVRQFTQIVNPVTPISDENKQIIFDCEPSSFFLDLANSLLSLKLKILMEDGTALRKY